ncbi:hypothetical protein [Pandoraea sp.]|uniref:hypothetical protein n=1 Tax=Pandoraea sp. TaxID=1883445 RepID=UPI0035B268D2
MNLFTYRAYYFYNGPSLADPFRTEKTADEVAHALNLFPTELAHFVPEGWVIQKREGLGDADSSYVTVATSAPAEEVHKVVAQCLNRLDLFADKIKAG